MMFKKIFTENSRSSLMTLNECFKITYVSIHLKAKFFVKINYSLLIADRMSVGNARLKQKICQIVIQADKILTLAEICLYILLFSLLYGQLETMSLRKPCRVNIIDSGYQISHKPMSNATLSNKTPITIHFLKMSLHYIF